MNDERTYEDYEELGRYLKTAEEAAHLIQEKVFDMFGGLGPSPLDSLGRSDPNDYDEYILEVIVRLQRLRSDLFSNFHAEIPESEVPPGKPRTPPYFYLLDDEDA